MDFDLFQNLTTLFYKTFRCVYCSLLECMSIRIMCGYVGDFFIWFSHVFTMNCQWLSMLNFRGVLWWAMYVWLISFNFS